MFRKTTLHPFRKAHPLYSLLSIKFIVLEDIINKVFQKDVGKAFKMLKKSFFRDALVPSNFVCTANLAKMLPGLQGISKRSCP